MTQPLAFPSGIELTSAGKLETTVELDPGSPWFSGHFPAAPIFPGVAMLDLVGRTLINHGGAEGRNVEIIGFRRIRFKNVAFPGQVLKISVKAPRGPGPANLTFEITRDREIVCQGLILAREAPADILE
ncbi:MAG: hypothetical protein V1816_21230 [Pseudomonadota bacterium]